MRNALRLAGIVVLWVGCGAQTGGREGNMAPPSNDEGPTTSDWGDVSDTSGDSSPPADTGPLGPRWFSWSGTDVLTVDVLADGEVDCTFEWLTTGLQVISPCEDCDFDFEVSAEFLPDSSSCSGAVPVLERRFWRDGRLYRDAQPLDEATLDISSEEVGYLAARSYALELDESYGAPVATTFTVRATLR